MNEPRPLTEREQSELVAYLDHELGEAAARRVEARLQQDPRLRDEAKALRQVWDLLDHLPQAEPSPAFTERTLQRASIPLSVAGSAPRPATPAAWRPLWAVGLAWVAVLLLSTWVGFAGFEAVAPPANALDRDLIRDLRLIENKRLYELLDDLEFLQELDQPDLFGDDKVGTS
jgi:anti-sigma factor RsiW